MFLEFNGGAMNNPSGLGVDSTGSVWVASYFYVASKFSPIGAAIFPSGLGGSGLNNSYGLAIDTGDNVWIPNEQPFTAAGIGSVTEFNSAGTTALSGGSGYLNGGLDYPLSVAIDPNGTVWVVDYGNAHVTLLNSSGTPLSGTSGYTTPLFAFPVAVAIDANHFGWIVNQSSNNLTKVAPDGSSFTNYSCCDRASGIAIDQGDNIWVADYFGDEVSLVTNSGTVVSSNLTGGGSIYHPQCIAIDGAGTAWVGNYRAAYLTELAGATTTNPGSSLSPAVGVGADAGLLEAYAIAIDASGNIWVSNQGNNTVTKFIGLAVPVKTPLSGLPQLP
jgi:streptogramin lyase